jgi:hypothetical protein
VVALTTAFHQDATAQYGASIIADAHISEFDPAPDVDERQNLGPTPIPLSAFAQRATSDATSQASGSVGASNTLRARAFTQTGTMDFTEGGPQVASVSVDVSDTFFFDRNGQPITGGSLEVSLSFSGSISASGDAQASVFYTIDVGPGLGTDPDTGEPDSLLLLELQGSDTFNFQNELGGVVDLPDLQGQGFPMTYSLYAGVTGGVQVSQADANASNSASLYLRYLDENGLPDPTVNIVSASGIDYAPVPEPSTTLLAAALTTVLVACRLRRS